MCSRGHSQEKNAQIGENEIPLHLPDVSVIELTVNKD